MSYDRIIAAFNERPWALLPSKLEAVVAFLRVKAGAESAEQAAKLTTARTNAVARRDGAVAVIPIDGVLSQRMNLLTETSGGASTELIGKQLRAALADASVKAVVLDVNSPGGDVYGVSELAAEIRAARGGKPIVAVANSIAASGAYWLASQADELVVTPGGQVGSIGVYTAHVDRSAQLAAEGEAVTLISAGKFKVEGNPFGPLTDEARAAMQQRVDAYYAAFVDDVAAGRGVKASAVRGGFGEGRMVLAADAVREGMADRVGTLRETLARLGVSFDAPKGGARASVLEREIEILES